MRESEAGEFAAKDLRRVAASTAVWDFIRGGEDQNGRASRSGDDPPPAHDENRKEYDVPAKADIAGPVGDRSRDAQFFRVSEARSAAPSSRSPCRVVGSSQAA